MSLELANTLATFGTFVVIAATAVAAIIQLRHARTSNQILALNEIRETMESADFQEARHLIAAEVPVKVQDPVFRRQFADASARTDQTRPFISKVINMANFYENIGTFVKGGLIDRELALDLWSGVVVGAWQRLAPLVAIARRPSSFGPNLWENFEYLTVLSQDWIAAHEGGAYPAGVRRIELDDEWLDADNRYAASLASA
jgi:Domain of unknown function (DUF4760)